MKSRKKDGVPWLDGTEGKAGECPARAGEILFHPRKIGVEFEGFYFIFNL